MNRYGLKPANIRKFISQIDWNFEFSERKKALWTHGLKNEEHAHESDKPTIRGKKI